MSDVQNLSFLCGCVLESVHSETVAVGLCPRHESLYSAGMTTRELADKIMITQGEEPADGSV